jgi:hypothetical protein
MWEDYLELGYRHRRPKLVEAGDGQHGEGQDPRWERDAVGVRVPG